MSFSHVVVVGRVGKDPEVRSLGDGKSVASFSIAVDTFSNGEKGVDWSNIVLFGKTADIAGQYVKKGSLVGVVGRLQTRSWDDKSSGEKKFRTEVVGNELKLLDKAPSGESASRPASAPVARPGVDPDDPFNSDPF